jgi:hypothetical protein
VLRDVAAPHQYVFAQPLQPNTLRDTLFWLLVESPTIPTQYGTPLVLLNRKHPLAMVQEAGALLWAWVAGVVDLCRLSRPDLSVDFGALWAPGSLGCGLWAAGNTLRGWLVGI